MSDLIRYDHRYFGIYAWVQLGDDEVQGEAAETEEAARASLVRKLQELVQQGRQALDLLCRIEPVDSAVKLRAHPLKFANLRDAVRDRLDAMEHYAVDSDETAERIACIAVETLTPEREP